MSAKKEGRAVDVSFGVWLELACKYDHLASRQLLSSFLLLVCAFLVSAYSLVVGISLLVGLSFAFVLTFRHVWKRACRNPPWYLSADIIAEAQKNDEAANH